MAGNELEMEEKLSINENSEDGDVTCGKPKEKEDYFQKKLEEYSQSFSIHGLSRVFHGHIYEKIFWLLNLLIALGIAVFLVRGQITNFLERNTYIDESYVFVQHNPLPTITICKQERMSTRKFCGKNIHSRAETYYGVQNLPCNYTKVDRPVAPYKRESFVAGVSYIEGTSVNCPISCDATNFHRLREMWKPVPNMVSRCMQWNVKSLLTFPQGKYEFRISSNQKHLKLFIHHSQDNIYLFDKYYKLSTEQDTEIRISKSFHKFLSAPYKSDCVRSEDKEKFTIFPGKYTIDSCLNTLKCKVALKNCGVTFDFCRPYMPQDLTQKYLRANLTLPQVFGSDCLRTVEKLADFTKCPVACQKYQYKVESVLNIPGKFSTKKQGIVSVELYDEHKYLVQEEKPLVTFTDLLGIIGGTIGLFCGFSILSMVELVMFMFIKTLVTHKKKKV